MKKDLHPTGYRTVVVEDVSNGFKFITKSTAKADGNTKWEDGVEYPLVKVHISSESHPFYTGQEKLLDIEGRVDRFKARQEAANKKKELLSNKAKKAAKKEESKSEPEVQKLGEKQVKPEAKKPKESEKPKAQKEEKKTEKPATDSKSEEAPAKEQ